jgi:hypothetical protein
MTESNKTKWTGMNIFHIWIQVELPNKFYNVNQQDTETGRPTWYCEDDL